VDVTTFVAPTNLSQRHVITDNRIENGTHGVSLSGAQGCVVANNVFTDTSHRAVIVSVSSRNQVSDNVATGQFSCAYLLCFGSRFNVVSGNIAHCTASVSEFNAFRASFAASDNQFTGNYAYGVTGAAFRAFTGSVNNMFVGNKAEACGQGLEFRSLVTDSGYAQNVNTPAMTGNSAIGNDFRGCTVGMRLWSGTTTAAGSTPATTAGIAVPLSAVLLSNRVRNSSTYGVLVLEDTPGVFASNTGVNNSVAAGNAVTESTTNDWSAPRGASHWINVQGNTGGGLQAVHRLPVGGNAVEWRDSLDAIKAYLTSTGGFGTTGRHSIGASTLPTVAMGYLNTANVANIGYRVDGQTAQTGDLLQITRNAGPSATVAPLTRIDKNGTFITAVHAAPADIDIAAGEMAVWFDQTNGASRMMIKAKQADGTVRTGQVALT
jgi:parallel beta-helix repeat protein